MGLFGRLFEGQPAVADYSPSDLGFDTNDTRDLVHIDVVGESNYQSQLRKLRAAIEQHQGDDPWFIVRFTAEPHNPHDPNAVKVTAWGLLVGYLPKARAKKARKTLDIVGGQQVGIAQLMGGTPAKPYLGVLAYARKGHL